MDKMLMEKAQQLTIMDAIEEGATKEQIIRFMQTDEFTERMIQHFENLKSVA